MHLAIEGHDQIVIHGNYPSVRSQVVKNLRAIVAKLVAAADAVDRVEKRMARRRTLKGQEARLAAMERNDGARGLLRLYSRYGSPWLTKRVGGLTKTIDFGTIQSEIDMRVERSA